MLSQAKIESFFRQFSDARDTYRQFMKSLDRAKVENAKKLKVNFTEVFS